MDILAGTVLRHAKFGAVVVEEVQDADFDTARVVLRIVRGRRRWLKVPAWSFEMAVECGIYEPVSSHEALEALIERENGT